MVIKMEIKKLLEVRKRIKKNKPTFVVKETNFSARVKRRWRFPRGKHSKVRQMHRGRPKLVNVGFGVPKAVRGLHSSGLETVRVHNKKELLSINPEKQGAIIARIGNNKKLKLLELAKEKNITLFNIKDLEKAIEEVKSSFANRKKDKEDKSKEKSKKEVEKKKKADEKKQKEEEPAKESKSSEGKEKQLKEQEDEEKKVIEKTIIKKQ
jgi:large subunit ribosomal protein L32e